MLIKIACVVLCAGATWLTFHFGLTRYRLANGIIAILAFTVFLLLLSIQWLYMTQIGAIEVIAALWFAAVASLGTMYSRRRLLFYIEGVREEPRNK